MLLTPAPVMQTADHSSPYPERPWKRLATRSARPVRGLSSELRAPRAQAHQVARQHQAVGRRCQRPKLVDHFQAAHHHLAHRTDQLASAESLLDALPIALAARVAAAPRRAHVDVENVKSVRVLHQVRRQIAVPSRLDKAARVVDLAGANRDAHSVLGHVNPHDRRQLTHGHTNALARLDVDKSVVQAIRQYMPELAPQRRRRLALAVRLQVRVGLELVLVAATPFAPRVCTQEPHIASILTPNTLVAGAGLDEVAAYAEALARHGTGNAGEFQDVVEQLRDLIVIDQPFSALAEYRMVPNRGLDGLATEPAKQQAVGQLLHEVPRAVSAVKHRQQHRRHGALRRDGSAATAYGGLAQRREPLAQLRKGLVDPLADRPKRVLGGDEILQPRELRFFEAGGYSHQGLATVARLSAMPWWPSIALPTVSYCPTLLQSRNEPVQHPESEPEIAILSYILNQDRQ
jgi:hypothetical protein